MSLTRERIESLAPDQASLAAALKLVKPATWPALAANADASMLWGECQGSGSTPYRVVVSPDDTGYKCTCPSRKFPCKHVLAVLWLRIDKPDRFETAAPPPWVEEWSARRRPGGGGPRPGRPKPDDGEAKEAPSLAAALTAEPEAPPDLKAAARAEAQRQRVKAERENAVLAGLDDLDRWILDQLSQGLAGFAQRSQTAVRTLSTRLVDAKASGLAARLDRLTAELFRAPEDQRADLAVERLAAMTLIASAWRHRDRLPPPLQEDARRAVGWSVRREELLADPAAPRVPSTWIVAANLSEVQPDKLRRLETWLVNAGARQGTSSEQDPRACDGAQPRSTVLPLPPSGGEGGGRQPHASVIASRPLTPTLSPQERGEGEDPRQAETPSASRALNEDAPRAAVLIDFVPVSGGAFGFPFEPGECIEGEVVFYPSAAPLRGLLATRKPAEAAPWPRSQRGVGPALEEFARRLGALPWLDSWPLMMDGVAIRTAGKGALVVADDQGRTLLVASAQVEALTPMLGLDGLSLVCLWDGRTAQVLAADTPIGRWHGG